MTTTRIPGDCQGNTRRPSRHYQESARRPTGHLFSSKHREASLPRALALFARTRLLIPPSVCQVPFFAANHASRGPVAARATHGTTQQTRCEQRTSCVQVAYVVYSVHNKTQRPDLRRGLQIMGRGEHLNQHPLYFQGKNPMVYHTAWGTRLLVQPFCFLPFPHCSLLGREA